MKIIQNLSLIIVCFLLVVSCSKGTVLDGSSKDNFSVSLKKMEASLSKEELLLFQSSMMLVAAKANESHPDNPGDELRKILHGKTAIGVIKIAQQYGKQKFGK